MLELKSITKSYQTANFSQTALDGVSIAFRDNEFAAVLGPSGSGKTTMLNIVGGLDQYDSGDLVIDGVSTAQYSDRDWDTYRNNRIGFVFQSYNLINHQTVLANVELALTLSGVSPAERRERALKALDDVGLSDHVSKRPTQMSGGQMQRVAIARALINDPEILLADEPTGALDTQTSLQVMELLVQIAKDRLVIMVTHNPELAQQYANRIVTLRDGHVIADTRPFDPAIEQVREAQPARRASMSFLTALSLSFSNLMTKKGRTIVTAFAGSIGIIGIAAILALANGIDNYIRTIEEETLSMYPLTIQTQGMDLSALMGGMGPPSSGQRSDLEENLIAERAVVQNMFAASSVNDLGALKAYFQKNAATIDPLVNSIEYRWDVTPQIFLADTTSGIEQVNPDGIMAGLGMGAGQDFGAMFGLGGFGMNTFSQLLSDPHMYEYQYNILAGRWPEAKDELVLVLSQSGRISDFELYSMGLLPRRELRQIINSVMGDGTPTPDAQERERLHTLDELMSPEFKVIHPSDRFAFDESFDVWVDRSNDSAFMRDLLAEALPLRIVGVVMPDPEQSLAALSSGINFHPDLITYLMESAAESPLVQEQLADRSVNAITGVSFAEERDAARTEFDFAQIINVDADALQSVFEIDATTLDLDFSSLEATLGDLDLDFNNLATLINPDDFEIDFSQLDIANLLDLSNITLPDPPAFDLADLAASLAGAITVDGEQLQAQLTAAVTLIMNEFLIELANLDHVPSQDELVALFAEFLMRAETQAKIGAIVSDIADTTGIAEQLSGALQSYIATALETYMTTAMASLQTQISSQMESALTTVGNVVQTQITTSMTTVMSRVGTEIERQLTRTMGTVTTELGREIETALTGFATGLQDQMGSVSPELLADAFTMNMEPSALLDLMSTLMNPVESSAERNLGILGFADPAVPSQIDIFPMNFAAKQQVIDILDNYNARMAAEGRTDMQIQYTDFIGVLMGSVTDIVSMVTVALIAFVAISLVVSSIMIGVITYISVLERRKEIGILRAIGASKLNIRQVFNAETLIVGFIAGALGILVTYLLTVVANAIIAARFDIHGIARLPISAALALIAVSMVLTFVSGLIPSSAAAREDPVAALRSE